MTYYLPTNTYPYLTVKLRVFCCILTLDISTVFDKRRDIQSRSGLYLDPAGP